MDLRHAQELDMLPQMLNRRERGAFDMMMTLA